MILRALIVLLAVASGACAARGGVPRPFPGAAVPSGAADAPSERVEAPADSSDEASAEAEPPVAAPPVTAAPAPAGAFGDLIRTALEFLGVPYRNGGSDPSGFDCSGFVQWVFGRNGLALPREVRDQYQVGRKVDPGDVREGDLLFFETVMRGASHVGIALGHGRFVHAPSSRGVVRVEPYTASYWSRRFVGARRLADAKQADARSPVTPRVFPGSIRSAR